MTRADQRNLRDNIIGIELILEKIKPLESDTRVPKKLIESLIFELKQKKRLYSDWLEG